MTIRFLTSLGTVERVYSAKEVADLPDALAAQWIKAGFCEPLKVANEPLIPVETEEPAAPARRTRRTTKDPVL